MVSERPPPQHQERRPRATRCRQHELQPPARRGRSRPGAADDPRSVRPRLPRGGRRPRRANAGGGDDDPDRRDAPGARRGFAFVGRQVHFEVEGSDFFVDLLFFHVEQLRYVVVELKTGAFRPENLGQLTYYVALVDDRLRRDHHAETVGLLLVGGKNDAVVRYALSAANAPVGVASYELLPPDLQRSLPTEAQLRRALLGGE
nr:PDDEXK nuclease domain-containing protein [Curtobacterium sp. SGAir0471]